MLCWWDRQEQTNQCIAMGHRYILALQIVCILDFWLVIIDLCLTWEIMFAPSTHRRTVEKAYFDGKLHWWGFAQCSLFFCLSFTIHLENSPCLPGKFTLPLFLLVFPMGQTKLFLWWWTCFNISFICNFSLISPLMDQTKPFLHMFKLFNLFPFFSLSGQTKLVM